MEVEKNYDVCMQNEDEEIEKGLRVEKNQAIKKKFRSKQIVCIV